MVTIPNGSWSADIYTQKPNANQLPQLGEVRPSGFPGSIPGCTLVVTSQTNSDCYVTLTFPANSLLRGHVYEVTLANQTGVWRQVTLA